jgi:hypothetical protein
VPIVLSNLPGRTLIAINKKACVQPSAYTLLGLASLSNYSCAALTGNAFRRPVYVGSLPATASVDELLKLVHLSPLESIASSPKSHLFSSLSSMVPLPRHFVPMPLSKSSLFTLKSSRLDGASHLPCGVGSRSLSTRAMQAAISISVLQH